MYLLSLLSPVYKNSVKSTKIWDCLRYNSRYSELSRHWIHRRWQDNRCSVVLKIHEILGKILSGIAVNGCFNYSGFPSSPRPSTKELLHAEALTTIILCSSFFLPFFWLIPQATACMVGSLPSPAYRTEDLQDLAYCQNYGNNVIE